jgi:hypothetical protein
MKHDPCDISFDARLTINVPTELRGAIERAACAQAISTADFVRLAVSDRLSAAGVPHQRVPPLRRRLA